ncbi:coiled-coil domain-containing protein 92-like [Haliotis cracherodii]|uniref:coiled-coil domain-containing protein 92-like n=1 Tax=Haliotis cracherodii TaxID=6455 RepID=UPI0039EC2A71
MATQAAVHQRNLESSILFMQQEHATTLKGLHEEIHTLQKKCTDLTFQITMQGYGLGEPESGTKLKGLQSQLMAEKEEKIKFETEVESRDKKIKHLESELHTQKKRYLGELRSQTHTINNFKAELEAKSNNIAYLTSELHRYKLNNKVDPGADPTIRRTQAPSYIPAPPKDIQSKLRRQYRRYGNADELQARPLRVASGKSSGSSRSESPDIAPFLKKGDGVPIIDKRQQTTILPPISKMGQERNAVLLHQVMSSQQLGRRKADSTSPEIATLAVEQVSRAEPGWVHHVQESTNSEYK